MFKFIPDHVGGVGTKRKSTQQKSCDSCKKRHKRCSHGVSRGSDTIPSHASLSPIPTSGGSHDFVSRPQVPSSNPAGPTSDTPVRPENGAPEIRPLSKESYLRFVGDLSPEASFLSHQHPSSESKQLPRHAEVGVWLGQRPESHDKLLSREKNGPVDNHSSQEPAQLTGLVGLGAISSRLRQECLAVLPPEYELGVLMSLYYAKVDPVFPILWEESLDAYSPSEAVVLKQCICLVAALDPKMRKHLRLPHKERILSPSEFRAYIAAAVKQSLDMGFISDNVVLLQVCTLMAFYADRANCSEVSAYYVSQAVHHTQTLGLHLGWPDDGTGAEKSRRIFWCIWVLDRLNAATNGRPVLLHRQDIDISLLETCAGQTPPFRLLIRTTQFLDSVISRYRPHSTAGAVVADESLTFEDLVREAKAQDVASALLATLEIFYLAVVILQHRPKETEGQSQPTPSSDLQFFAATSIISIASEDFKSSMTFWPVAPYAVSLATSVAYKSLRNSCMAYRRKRAYALFHNSCDVLDELAKTFSSARAMAKLATDTMKQVERVAADRSKARQPSRDANGSPRVDRDGVGTSHIERAETTSRSTRDGDEPVPVTVGQQPIETTGMYPPLFDNTLLDDFIGDAGIFNDFDPSFDLDRIDQVFSANLDPTQPPQDWLGYIPLG